MTKKLSGYKLRRITGRIVHMGLELGYNSKIP